MTSHIFKKRSGPLGQKRVGEDAENLKKGKTKFVKVLLQKATNSEIIIEDNTVLIMYLYCK
jgi:hypothetical protein